MIETIVATVYLTGAVLTFKEEMGGNWNYPEGPIGPLITAVLWPLFLFSKG